MWLDENNANNGIPRKYKRNIKTFNKHNPDHDIKFWNLESTSALIEKHLPEFYQTFLDMTP